MAKTNKSGNMRGMSKGSQEAIAAHNLKNKSKKECCEFAAKGGEAKHKIDLVKKDILQVIQEDADEEIANKDGKKYSTRQALIKKIKQMALNGNLRAIELYIKLLGEDPAEKLEITNKTPQIVVASQADADLIKEIQNVKTNENIL